MKVLEITGGKDLNGTIRISGAKNSSVALIPAASAQPSCMPIPTP